MRPPLIAGNWKMNGSIPESVELARALRAPLDAYEGPEVLVCPPYLALSAVQKELSGSRIRLGAQDMHWETKGAFTGEISGPMLKEVGATHVILGHSERRHVIGEGNDLIARKVRAALAQGFVPILCVGELLEERNMKVTHEVIDRQLTKGIEGIPAEALKRLVIAYEPVWAIGTGLTATPGTASDVHHFIRKTLARLSAPETAEAVRILYGGSVKPENARDLMKQPDIDGLLVGGASLEAASFSKIVKYKES